MIRNQETREHVAGGFSLASTPFDALMKDLPSRLSDIPTAWAARTPDAIALSEGGTALSYRQLDDAVSVAAELLQGRGVRPGDRLMIVAENCIAQVVLMFAAARMDAWAVNVNARLSAHEVDALRDHSEPRRIVYTVAASGEARAHAERHGAEPLDLPGVGQVAMGSMNASCRPEPVESDGRKQVAALIYTTGTTGQPKGVMLTHHNLLFIACVSGYVRGVNPADRVYGVLPLTHVFGLASVALGTLYAGARLCLVSRYAPSDLVQALKDEGITILQGVPAMYARLLEYDFGGWSPARSSLRFIYAGGAPLDPTLKQDVERLFGRTLHNGYGMTESSPTISQTRIDAPRDDTSVGFAIPGIELRILDGQGREVADGEPGELWIRGPNVMKGYYREPELTAAAIDAEGWLATGDVVRRDAQGALFIAGRSKEVIIRSGFNVYPIEVEAALNTHPAVVQSAVVGCPVEGGNEEVVAFVELEPSSSKLDIAVLRAWLEQRLSPYKRPSRIVVMETMPAAATGKILKGQLKHMAKQMQ